MSQKRKSLTCNRDQANHLQSLLTTANRKHSDHIYQFKLLPGAEVIAARKTIARLQTILNAHDRKERRIKEDMQARLRKTEKDVRQVILFGTPEEALKAVANFEQAMF